MRRTMTVKRHDRGQTARTRDARSASHRDGRGPPTIRLEQRRDGRLWMICGTVAGEAMACPVRVRPCFPWSQPARFLSLRDDDDEEVGLVRETFDLDDASRTALEQVLIEAGFVFELTAVLHIDEEVELRHWQVRTRQGLRSFQTRLDDWPRRLPDGGLLIRDVCGDLYLVREPAALDETSRALLWAFVDV